MQILHICDFIKHLGLEGGSLTVKYMSDFLQTSVTQHMWLSCVGVLSLFKNTFTVCT